MTTERVAPAINPWHVAQQQFDIAADRPRTRSKARARLLELFEGVKQPERVAILDCKAPEVASFADDLAQQLKFPRDEMTFNLVGPSVGPHVGPGAYGAVVLPRLAP